MTVLLAGIGGEQLGGGKQKGLWLLSGPKMPEQLF
jgi:hypothetical protein